MTTIDEQTTPTTLPTWHHPHFISVETKWGRTHHEFKEFTGDEPEPALPPQIVDAFRAACDSRAPGALNAWGCAEREADAAHKAWTLARFRRDVVAGLRKAAPLAEAYLAARKAADDAYNNLGGTPDGWWRSALLTLSTVRQAAIEAAGAFDRAMLCIAEAEEALPSRVYEYAPSVTEIANEVGVDTTGWKFSSYDFALPMVRQLTDLFKTQDKRIAEVGRLVGDQEGR